VQWRRAWRTLRALIDDPERTEKVFELLEAVGGDGGERHLQRFLRHPEGRRLLAQRPRLEAALGDRRALASRSASSLGRAYLEFAQARDFAASGLIEVQRGAEAGEPPDPARRWFYDRTNVMHDLWHVLTGYGTDPAGEAALLAFTCGQIPNRGLLLLVMAAAVLGVWDGNLGWPRYLFRAWRRGRRATLMTAAPYEELLPRPLEEVRLRLGIQPIREAHPEGIVVGSLEGDLTRAA
jgi:ubiquinone biosynthesis protein COQ4